MTRERTIKLTTAEDGTVNLHLFREGEEYLTQKGGVFLRQWNNVVFATRPGPDLPNTRYLDLSTQPLDYLDETFDAIDAYHIFEHLTPSEGERMARAFFRVLKRGGIFRLSVPDLEETCRQYLARLQVALGDPSKENLLHYQWAMLLIFEQMVRERSGGMMSEMTLRGQYVEEQIRQLHGDALNPLLKWAKTVAENPAAPRPAKKASLSRRIARRARSLFRQPSPAPPRELHPRETREAVRWMYDRLSLRLLMEGAGFSEFVVVDHARSGIPNWDRYDLDRSNYGDYALDPSVYVEARKPGK